MKGQHESDVVLSTQRRLRVQLLDCASAIAWSPARDLAAHLLLSLDDTEACWRMSVEWLRDAFDVDRVEGGAFEASTGTYALGRAQARRKDVYIPSVRGICMPLNSQVLRELTKTAGPAVFDDIKQATSLAPNLRQDLVRLGTRVKIASSLKFEGATFGFLCMDHVDRSGRWTSLLYERFDIVSGRVLGPILGASHNLACRIGADDPDAFHQRLLRLSPAERRVLELLGDGMSYKRIARQLGRSVHTVDHQLRSIRGKLEVASNIQVVGLLSRSPAEKPGGDPPARCN